MVARFTFYKQVVLFLPFLLRAQSDLPGPIRVLPLNSTTPSHISVWDKTQTYESGFTVSSSLGSNNIWQLPTSSSSGCWGDNGSHVLSIVSCGSGSTSPGGSTTQVQTNISGAFYGDSNFTYVPGSKQVTISGNTGTAGLVVSNAFVQSAQGFLSTSAQYNAYQDTSGGGAVFPGLGISQYNQVGGYIDIPQLVYPYSGTTPCYDTYGNLATQPNYLTGATTASYTAYNSGTTYSQYQVIYNSGVAYYSIAGGNVGHTPPNATYWVSMGGYVAGNNLSDVIIWNGPSPLQGTGGGCPTPPLTNELNGLNVSSYIFAGYGFATNDNSYNSFQSLSGGMYAKLGYTAGQALYPFGQTCSSLNVPGSGYGGWGWQSGSTYCYYNGSSWQSVNLAASSGVSSITGTTNEIIASSSTGAVTLSTPQAIATSSSVTFASITGNCPSASSIAFQTDYSSAFDFQVDCQGNVSVGGTGGSPYNGVFSTSSTTGGFNVTANNSANSIQTVGGVLAGGNAFGGFEAKTTGFNYESILNPLNLVMFDASGVLSVELDGTTGNVRSIGHISNVGGSLPSVSGTGCTVLGGSTDVRGAIIQSGIGYCTLTFATTYTSIPTCITTSDAVGITSSVTGINASLFTIYVSGSSAQYYYCIQ